MKSIFVNNVPGMLRWDALPELPGPGDGVADAFVGISNGMLMVAGGANFSITPGGDRWTADKVFHRAVSVWPLEANAGWRYGFEIEMSVAYGSVATTSWGIACLGGDGETGPVSACFLLWWDGVREQPVTTPLPDLPVALAYGGAAAIGGMIYVAGGQTSEQLVSATNRFWALDLGKASSGGKDAGWEELPPLPGSGRAFHVVAAQHNGFEDCIYVMSGRRVDESGKTEALVDVWEYSPSKGTWHRRTDAPAAFMAGTGAPLGQSHILIPSGADASALAIDAGSVRDAHPGFCRRAWIYHTITDSWEDTGGTPQNQVMSPAVAHDGAVYLASGEIRPRTRTREFWRISSNTVPSATDS